MSGYVQTITGRRAPGDLGLTLMHEHVLCDVTPPDLAAQGLPRTPVTLMNSHAMRYAWTGHYGNHILDDTAVLADELRDFRASGGGTIVELTIRGIAPDPAGLARLSAAADVAIVAGTGFYTHAFCGDLLEALSTDAMAEAMIGDLSDGFDGTGLRAGIIGEIGVSDPWHPDERRAMTAAALAQVETGAAISVHPGRDPASPARIVAHLVKHGVDPARIVIGHLDRTFTTPDQALRLAAEGCVLEWDFFGIESSYYPFADIDMPNDALRLRMIRGLLDRGHDGQVVISHDICTQTRLRRGGGHGYGHIPDAVRPMMRRRDFSEGEITRILVETPRRLLTLPGPA